MPEVNRFIDSCVACGAGVVVLAAYTGVDGYDARPELDDAGWATLLGNLDRIADHARTRGVVAALHPHVGTMVESGEETERVLVRLPRRASASTPATSLVGGGDPVAITAAHPERVVHVHLKDVDAAMAARVRAGELDLRRRGPRRACSGRSARATSTSRPWSAPWRPRATTGWYVLEQDVVLDGDGAERRAVRRRARPASPT